MLSKRANVETSNHLEWEFTSNLFSRRKKRWGERTSNNLETPKSVYTSLYQHFKMEGLHCLRNVLQKRLLTELEGCILFSFIKSCIQKICAVSLVRETLRVSFPLFWTKPSTKNYYKITQNSSFSVSSPEYSNYNLLGQHVVDRPYNRSSVNGQRRSNTSSTTRVCAGFKEISVYNYTENRVLRG